MTITVEQIELIAKLRETLAASDELILCPDVDTVYKRAVELARTQLGMERCAIYLLENEHLRGTYGTSLQQQTTDEHKQSFALNDTWKELFQYLQPKAAGWTVVEEMHWEWDGERSNPIGEGWIGLIPIRSASKLIGVLINDTAISQKELDPIVQEMGSVFCSLLGNIVERKQAEEALLKMNSDLEARIQERLVELEVMNSALQTETAERSKAEDAYLQERNLLRTLIDNLPDYIFVKDKQGRFVLSNPAHAFAGIGVSDVNDLIGKTAYDFFPEPLATQYTIDDQKVMEDGQVLIGVERLTRNATGNPIWVSTTKIPLFGTNGEVVGLMGMSCDITSYKEAREALENQKAFLRQIIDANPNPMYLRDENGKFTLANQALANLYGTDVENLIGKSDADFNSNAEEVEKMLTSDREVLATLQPCFISEEKISNVITKYTYWFQTVKLPLRSPDGDGYQVLGVSTDITDRKQIENALRKAHAHLEQRVKERTVELSQAHHLLEQKLVELQQTQASLAAERNLLRTLIDNLPHYIYAKDREGHFITSNMADTQAMGAGSLEDVIGKSDFDFYPEELAAQYYQDDLEVIRTGQPLINREEMTTDEVGNKICLLTNKFPLRDAQGEITGLVGIGVDISDRKRAEQDLIDFRDQLKALHEVSLKLANVETFDELNRKSVELGHSELGFDRLGLWFVDENPDYILGSFGIDETGQIRDERHVKLVLERAGLFSESPRTGKYEDDVVLYNHCHEPVGKGWIAAATLWDGDKVIGWICTDNLVSRRPFTQQQLQLLELYGLTLGHLCTRKRAETLLRQAHQELERRVEERTAELRIANEEIKRFAYIVSHDLRAPLVNIKGFSSELTLALESLHTVLPPILTALDGDIQQNVKRSLQEDVPEALDFINASITRMDYLINAILKLSRLGRRQLQTETINTTKLVEEILKTLGHQLTEKHVTVTLDALPDVVADRTAMEQIMGNILANAVLYLDATRPGEIEITGAANGLETTFHIRDNGQGIAEENQHKVFEPFRRAGSHESPGEGMGLAYVQTLVRRHEGRIWFQSEFGTGTTFSFTISNQLTEEGYHD